ncbi:MAG: hypothetical protein LW729_05645 [Bacteroidetes bacterium]|nr:hypothetical protein [Bacteroidota bacterium]
MSHHPPSPSNHAKIAWAVGALFLLRTLGAAAQCPHNPTVTPNNLIFCPNAGSDTLWTQSYQAYQWYKDGVLQPGDTFQYRRVTHLDAGSIFSVDATLNGCTERSPQVPVDGWVFLLPVVATDGLQFPLCVGRNLSQLQSTTRRNPFVSILALQQRLGWKRNKQASTLHMGSQSPPRRAFAPPRC